MTATDFRAAVSTVAPYATIIVALAFAKYGLDSTITSLVVGGCLAAIDPRRGQTPAVPEQRDLFKS